MRGADSHSESLFTTVKLEDFVPANHPLRPIRIWVNEALAKMDVKAEMTSAKRTNDTPQTHMRHSGRTLRTGQTSSADSHGTNS